VISCVGLLIIRKKLEARVAELEELTNPKTIAGHTYPAQMVLLAVFMVA
jgi:hypothetical protein